jgi:hypothetical protein
LCNDEKALAISLRVVPGVVKTGIHLEYRAVIAEYASNPFGMVDEGVPVLLII